MLISEFALSDKYYVFSTSSDYVYFYLFFMSIFINYCILIISYFGHNRKCVFTGIHKQIFFCHLFKDLSHIIVKIILYIFVIIRNTIIGINKTGCPAYKSKIEL